MPKDVYINTPPEWNASLRTMLATTINRPILDEDIGANSTSSQPQKSSGSQTSGNDIRFGVNGNRTDLSMMGGFSSASSLLSSSQKRTKKKISSGVKRQVKEESDLKRAKLQKML